MFFSATAELTEATNTSKICIRLYSTGVFVVLLSFDSQSKGVNWEPEVHFPVQRPGRAETLKSLKHLI